MIKINLLPVKEKKRRQQVLIAVYIAMALVLLACLLGWLLSTRYHQLDMLKKEIAKIDEESAGYKEKIAEIKALEASQASLTAFRSIGDAIAEKHKTLIGALDQIASRLPAEVWLTGIQQGTANKANELTIRGYSFSETNLKSFAGDLGKPGGFLSQPTTVGISYGSKSNGNTVYQFELKTNMAVPK